MALTIELPSDTEAALEARAKQAGLPIERYALQLLQRNLSAEVAARRMIEIRESVKPDPEGWTSRDYVDHGRA